MFNWVVKVVPQPPEASGTLGDEATAKTSKVKQEKSPRAVKKPDEVSEESQAQSGVLGWLSNEFVSALPQPTGSPRLGRDTSETRSGEDGERSGVIGWVAQGLTKVLPQPDEKYRLSDQKKNENQTEVYDVEEVSDYDPLPHIPVVEMVSEDEMSETESLTPQFPSKSKMVSWLKNAIPQPVILPPGAVPLEPQAKSDRSSLDKILSPPPDSLSGISLDSEGRGAAVVGWFVSGLGLRLPQPVTTPKDDAAGTPDNLKKGGKALRAP